MYAVITPDQLQLPPGAVVRLLGSWQDYFPEFDVATLVKECMESAYARNTSSAIQALRQRLLP